ncbi:glyoxylate/hydroxypyruvate reductase A [Paraburkholderia sp. D15]|uniref:2-hydroxyacid dehydrogenase n=1 Tax=Paraburkholderia sp. D15 TaxID=2880218 RepID=UPI002479CA20|nr:glyoxylate/hydroxypyruvate reductase A [Paraburkholderia sp. D15]WGS54692.1 glyoxylate/hydroxypyruvate reductase A [Paraburkholderia sp. D15]
MSRCRRRQITAARRTAADEAISQERVCDGLALAATLPAGASLEYLVRRGESSVTGQLKKSRVLMLLTSKFVEQRYEVLRATAPEIEVLTALPEYIDSSIEAMFTFRLPAGVVPRLPALKLVASAGAGADGILGCEDLPAHVRVTRAVDPGLGFSMAQFVAMQILRQFRSLSAIEKQHAAAEWKWIDVPDARKFTVGLMGMGSMGRVVADVLTGLGFRVTGWVRNERPDSPVPTFSGEAGLAPFLSQSDFLVCLLPLTMQTRGLLNRETLSQLPRHSYVINVARGGIVVENDLLELIASGHLSGAALDVFATEPLPLDSPFWRHERVLVSPHCAAQPAVEPVVEQFIENLRRLSAGEKLLNEVDRTAGY